MAAVAPTGRTTPADDPGVSIVGATGVALAAEATEITPGFTNFIALATAAGAWRLLAGSGDAALAARALKRTALRTERPSEAIVRAGGRAWLVPLPLNGRLVGCAVFLADHDRAMPVSEAAFLGTFARQAAIRLADAVERQRDALADRLDAAVRELPRLLHAATRDPEMLAVLGASLERAIPSCNWAVALRGVGQRAFKVVSSSPGVAEDDPAFLGAAKQAVSGDQVAIVAPRRGDVAPPGAFVAVVAPVRDVRMRCIGAMVVRVPGDQGVEDGQCIRPFTLLSDLLSVALDLAAVAREARILQRRDAETGCLSPDHLREVTAALIDACAIGNKSGALLLVQAVGDESGSRGDISIARSLRRFVDQEAGADVSIARMGASRYAIVAPDRSLRETVTLAARLRFDLRTSDEGAVGSSVGIAMLPLNGETFDAACTAAAEALDEALETGGDCERVAVPKRHPTATPNGPVDETRTLEMLRTLTEVINRLYFGGTDHSGAVAARAGDIAVRLGVQESLVRQVTLAGEFHDVGRSLLTPELFFMSEPSDAERRLVQTHVVLGARLVANAGFPEAADCIASMHERWDGDGQPNGDTGLAIPTGARILAAANTFETVLGGFGRGDRGMRSAVTAVLHERGRSLDPQVVDSLLASLRASAKATASG